MTQNNLGNALCDQAGRTEGAAGTALLAEAVAAYRAALEVHTRAAHPVDWAMTQNNLGVALADQAGRTEGAAGAALLAEAAAAYRAALEVRTRAEHPVDWAMTQNNLAIALAEQAGRTRGGGGGAARRGGSGLPRGAGGPHPGGASGGLGEDAEQPRQSRSPAQAGRTEGAAGAALLAEAVAAYRAALEVYTRAAHPVDWAMTQNNLGVALADQAGGPRGRRGRRCWPRRRRPTARRWRSAPGRRIRWTGR